MIRQRHNRRSGTWLSTIVVLVTLLNILSWQTVYGRYLKSAVDTSKATLHLAVTGVNAALRRYEPLPALIAERPITLAVLRDPQNSGLLPFANQQLRLTTQTLDASAALLSDRQGTVLLASNYRDPHSSLGNNIARHGDFATAVQGRLGLFHSVDESDGRRKLHFAAPVLDGVDVAGVVSVHVDLSDLETRWRVDGRDIVLLDPNGIVFLSSRREWLLHTMTPLSREMREQIRVTRQFPTADLPALGVTTTPLKADSARLRIDASGDHASYLASSVPLVMPGWHAASLTPEGPVVWQAVTFQALWSLALISVLLMALLLWQRRQRTVDRMVWLQEQQQLLELRIAERTADLDTSNAALTLEIEERRQTEKRLRSTQHELVQAGKLAALGGMSAALAHEINQPLAAMKAYAGNAITLLDRERTAETRENLDRISTLVDRIATLSTRLRTFARRPRRSIGTIEVDAVIDAALEIMEPEIRKTGARVDRQSEPQGVCVIGGQLRLQQVLVNLLSNALDASVDGEPAYITVAIVCALEAVEIVVSDNGSGLDDDTIDQVFEPFFTTKESGKGLGLGLSISFNIVEDFGGRLSAHNRKGGGAEFRIRLRRAAGGLAAADDGPASAGDATWSAATR